MAVEVYSKIHEVLKDIQKGAFFRINYMKEVPVSKRRCKEEGKNADAIKIFKLVSTTVRTGVAYNNISKVADKLQEKVEDRKPRTNNWVWIEKNICKFNTNTSKFYLCCATIPEGAHYQVSYSVSYDVDDYHSVYTKEQFENSIFYNLLNESDKTSKGSCEYFTVSYDNITSINGKSVL